MENKSHHHNPELEDLAGTKAKQLLVNYLHESTNTKEASRALGLLINSESIRSTARKNVYTNVLQQSYMFDLTNYQAGWWADYYLNYKPPPSPTSLEGYLPPKGPRPSNDGFNHTKLLVKNLLKWYLLDKPSQDTQIKPLILWTVAQPWCVQSSCNLITYNAQSWSSEVQQQLVPQVIDLLKTEGAKNTVRDVLLKQMQAKNDEDD